MAADRWPVNQFDAISGARATNDSVHVAWDDQGASRSNWLVLLRLDDLYLDPWIIVQAFRESRCEIGRHVLDDDGPGGCRSEAREQLLEGLNAAGADTDHDDPVAGTGAGRIGNSRQNHVGGMPRVGRGGAIVAKQQVA